MSDGIYLKNCTNGIISNSKFSGLDCGIRAVDSSFVARNIVFDNVGTAIKGTGQTSIEASDLTNTERSQDCSPRESCWGADATSLEIIKRFANANV